MLNVSCVGTKIQSIIKMFMTFSEENNVSENNVVPANTNLLVVI